MTDDIHTPVFGSPQVEATNAELEAQQPPHLGDATLRFHLSADGDYIELDVLIGDTCIELPYRAHHQLLLILAEQRLAHASDRELSPRDHGWIRRSHLRRMLQGCDNLPCLYACRARKQLEDAGIEGGSMLIEMRRGTGQRRIGVGRLEVIYR